MKPCPNRLKKKYERRVLCADRAGLVAANLEMALDFISCGDYERAGKAVCRLAEALDFRYGLSRNLYDIYMVIEKKLAACISNDDMPAAGDAKLLIQLLLDKWKDCPEPSDAAVQSTQKRAVFVGLTYDAAGLCEYVEQDYSGGFKA